MQWRMTTFKTGGLCMHSYLPETSTQNERRIAVPPKAPSPGSGSPASGMADPRPVTQTAAFATGKMTTWSAKHPVVSSAEFTLGYLVPHAGHDA